MGGKPLASPQSHSECLARSTDIWLLGLAAEGRHMTLAHSRSLQERKFQEPSADSALPTGADHKGFWECWVPTAFQAVACLSASVQLLLPGVPFLLELPSSPSSWETQLQNRLPHKVFSELLAPRVQSPALVWDLTG